MHKKIRPQRVLASRIMLLGSLSMYFACSGLDCPNGGGSASSEPVFRAYAFVTNAADNTVSRYYLDLSTPHAFKLVPLGTTPVGKSPQAVITASINPSGGRFQQIEFVYVANTQDNTISQFRVHTDGTLTPLKPPAVPTGQGPIALITGSQDLYPGGLTASQAYVYCANSASKSVSAFKIGADGSLGLVATAALDGVPSAICSSEGQSIFISSISANTVSQFIIVPDSQGSLKRGAPFTYSNGSGEASLDASAYALYVANDLGDSVTTYFFDSSAALTAEITSVANPLAVSGSPIAIGADHSVYEFGDLGPLAIATASGSLITYAVNNTTNQVGDTTLPQYQIVYPAQIATFTPQPVVLHYFSIYPMLLKQQETNLTLYFDFYNEHGDNKDSWHSASAPTGNQPSAFTVGDTENNQSNIQTTVK